MIKPPYGFRLGVIPIFISLADLCFKEPLSHYFDDAYVRCLDGNHYDLIMKFPKKAIIHYTPVSKIQQKYLDRLADVFASKDVSIQSIISVLVRWRSGIPESTKLSPTLSVESRKLLIEIDSAREPDKFLFEKIPSCFNSVGISTLKKLDEIEEVVLKISKAKKEIERVYKNLLSKIRRDLTDFVSFIDRDCLGNVSRAIDRDKFVKTFQDILVQIKDYQVSRVTDRFVGRVLNFDSSNHVQYFLETVSDVLTGSSPRHWNEKGYFSFRFALKRVKAEIELACEVANPNYKGKSVLAFIDRGEQRKFFLKLGSISSVDDHLLGSVKKVKAILNSFDEIDKRKVILSVLDSFNKEDQVCESDDVKDVINRESEVNV